MTRVGVVGGGAVGLTAAAHLAGEGADVVLYERGELGSGSTGRAAGICYDAFAEDVDARVAAGALRRFRELGVLTACPYVWLAREGDDANADAIREQVPRMRAHGRSVALLDGDDLSARYPHLRTDDVAVAGEAREAGLVEPEAYVSASADRARASGAELLTDTSARLSSPTTVETEEGAASFDAVLVAAGPATKPLVADVGASLALKAYRAQALVTAPLRATLPTTYDATGHIYWRPKDDGLLVGNGAHEVDPADWDAAADDSFVDGVLDRVRAATTVDPAVDRSWAGLCTATPDRNPLLGELTDGLFVATGWHGHGFMRAPALGETVATELLGGDGIEPFDPTRFDGGEEFDVVEGMTLDGG